MKSEQDSMSFQLVALSRTIFTKSEKIKVLLVILFQSLLNLADLAGVIITGLISSIVLTKTLNSNSNFSNNPLTEILNINSSTNISMLGKIALFTLLLLGSKTIISLLFTRKILNFFTQKSYSFSVETISRLLTGDYRVITRRNKQSLIYQVTQGVDNLVIGIVGSVAVMVPDILLLVVLFLGIMYVNWLTSILTILIFGITLIAISKFQLNLASNLGKASTLFQTQTESKLLEALQIFKEARVRNQESEMLARIIKPKTNHARINSELNFLPYVSKYVFEFSILLGAGIIGLVQYLKSDLISALSTTILFAVASSRIAPALLRIQQGMTQTRISLGRAYSFIELLQDQNRYDQSHHVGIAEVEVLSQFVPTVQLKNVSFSRENSDFSLKNINLLIKPGELVAFVGPSGSGKSTLIDLICGLLIPNSGEITISGLAPRDAIHRWQGAVSYMPQEIFTIEGGVYENVTLKGKGEAEHEPQLRAKVDRLFRQIGLSDLSQNPTLDVEASKLSGGQKQRLAFARALYTSPSLLILDEPTSSLDIESQEIVMELLSSLKGKITIIVIAHRLGTLSIADYIYHIENGSIKRQGDYNSLIKDNKNSAKLFLDS